MRVSAARRAAYITDRDGRRRGSVLIGFDPHTVTLATLSHTMNAYLPGDTGDIHDWQIASQYGFVTVRGINTGYADHARDAMRDIAVSRHPELGTHDVLAGQYLTEGARGQYTTNMSDSRHVAIRVWTTRTVAVNDTGIAVLAVL